MYLQSLANAALIVNTFNTRTKFDGSLPFFVSRYFSVQPRFAASLRPILRSVMALSNNYFIEAL